MTSRLKVTALSMSAMALLIWVSSEGWAPVATRPIPGDVCTNGFGNTTNEDGSPVKCGVSITPVQAVRRMTQGADEYGKAIQKCFGPEAETHQWEFDAFALLAKNVGGPSVCRSSIPGKVQRGEYEAACKTIIDFAGITRNGKRLSCADRKNNCYGVYDDKLKLERLCLTGEYPK